MPVPRGPLRVIPIGERKPITPKPFLPDAALQTAAGPLVSTTPGLNFDGLGVGFVGPQGTFVVTSAPPDSNGAVGATQFVEWLNTSFAVFNKSTGAPVYGPAAGNTLWSGFGGRCQTANDGDPIAQYDKAAQRWVLTQLAVTGGAPYVQCVAVSTTSDATGSYNRYAFTFDAFNDYPKVGVWPDAYYITFNMFSGNNGLGARVCALDRAAMLNGAAATAQCVQLNSSFESLLPSDLDGSTPPPSGSPNFLINIGADSLNLWKFHVDWATPANSSFTGPTNIPVAAFTEACNGGVCIPQGGTQQKLDSLGDRLMYRLAYRNFGDHEALVATHSVGSPSGARWYELRDPNGAPVVFQQGTFAPDASDRWMGSIAMDSAGDIAVGYSVSSATLHPAIRYTGRVPDDVLGTMQAETSIFEGTGSQTKGLERWGDYTSMSIDPVDDCTFWYTNQYLVSNGSFNWHTRLASFKFPSCVPPPSGTPTVSPTVTNTATATPTRTATATRTPTSTSAFTPTRTATRTATSTLTSTAVPSATATRTPTSTATASSSATATLTASVTATQTATPSLTSTQTATPSRSPTLTFTNTPTGTATQTATNTPTTTLTLPPTMTATGTPTSTSTFTPSVTATQTATPSLTSTTTATPSRSPTLTFTNTPTGTATQTATQTPTTTLTLPPTLTPTGTPTSTSTLTPSPTSTNTATSTLTATETPTASATHTVTDTPTQTPAATATDTETNTPTPTATNTPAPTPTTTPMCTCLGDADKNGFVNSTDFAAVQSHFGLPADPLTGLGDADCNGFINSSDFGAVQAHFGLPCQ